MSTLVHSILLEGPSGCGKSTLLNEALKYYGSGIVIAAPTDELDSQHGLQDNPRYSFKGFDDEEYLPSLGLVTSTGLKNAVDFLRTRYAEIVSDVKSGKPPRYAVLGLDTISGLGRLALNATMAQLKRTEPPPAQSPDGAAFYIQLRQRQEEFLRLARAFRGYGVHLIALSHVTETDVKGTQSANVVADSSRMNMPDMPGGMKNIVGSYFSTVLYGGVAKSKDGKPVPYVQWKPDPKRPTKNRFGDLNADGAAITGTPTELWTNVRTAIEAAAAKRGSV